MFRLKNKNFTAEAAHWLPATAALVHPARRAKAQRKGPPFFNSPDDLHLHPGEGSPLTSLTHCSSRLCASAVKPFSGREQLPDNNKFVRFVAIAFTPAKKKAADPGGTCGFFVVSMFSLTYRTDSTSVRTGPPRCIIRSALIRVSRLTFGRVFMRLSLRQPGLSCQCYFCYFFTSGIRPCPEASPHKTGGISIENLSIAKGWKKSS
jgi:hypothetical protein